MRSEFLCDVITAQVDQISKQPMVDVEPLWGTYLSRIVALHLEGTFYFGPSTVPVLQRERQKLKLIYRTLKRTCKLENMRVFVLMFGKSVLKAV